MGTPLHTAVSRGSLEIVKLLVSKAESSGSTLVVKKTGGKDNKDETAFQLAVRLGYQDIVDYLKDQDDSWRENEEGIVKTVYSAVAGGHKQILCNLIKEGELKWEDISGDLLMRAVENNNLTAVNTLFARWDVGDGKTLTDPPDSEFARAIEIATAKKNCGQEKESKTAQNIIEKLSPSKSNELNMTPEVKAEIDKEKRRQYRRLVKDLKRTSKHDETKLMDYYLDEFSKVRNLNQNRIAFSPT